MKYPEISEANAELKRLKEVYRYRQIYIDNLKSLYWDSYDYPDTDRDVWEVARQNTIKFEGQLLKKYEIAIRELRKKLRDLNRKQNLDRIIKVKNNDKAGIL